MNIQIDKYFEPLEIDIEIVCDVTIYRENYGADADGNRGQMITYGEMQTIKIEDEEGNDITNMIEGDFNNDFYKIIEEAEEKAAEDWR